MKINTWFGTLEIDSTGEILESLFLSKDIRELALHSLSLRDSKSDLPPEGFDLKNAAIKSGFVNSPAAYYSLLHEVTLEAAKLQVSGALTPDQRIIQAVEALDDINETTNALSERLSEWYGGYFPESGLGGEDLALFIVKYGSRENVGSEDPLYSKARNSMGAKLEPADEILLIGFAENVCSLYERRRQIEAYIENSMELVAPNLKLIAGPMLGARLISLAGSLEKLAEFPSSTIQVIGASKALFKHLRARAPSPKHGIIYSHPLINTAPWWVRGKVARAVASKLSLAARIDFYSGEIEPSIMEKLEAKVLQIRTLNPRPPQKRQESGAKPKKRRRK
ncbi:NOP5/NOP56 family protein [Methanosarcina barkeri]|uniref:rRNA biogeneis protein n=2 Tax=Methanosarcina barkeri TaxID=2208 RepID=A0A0G3CJB4_METBA|nr:NOP5/NOP56 family protein [Methanosarcina barkeri]AKB58382.1 rRNA biogenesis protein Nop5/Nop56 [Methanosarcina barkeri 227]AKJ39172.1 rRNA biogeneis protein [Methanosarcina barkeri CM1]